MHSKPLQKLTVQKGVWFGNILYAVYRSHVAQWMTEAGFYEFTSILLIVIQAQAKVRP